LRGENQEAKLIFTPLGKDQILLMSQLYLNIMSLYTSHLIYGQEFAINDNDMHSKFPS